MQWYIIKQHLQHKQDIRQDNNKYNVHHKMTFMTKTRRTGDNIAKWQDAQT